MKAVEAEGGDGQVKVDGDAVLDINTDLALERESKGFVLLDDEGVRYVAFPVDDIAELVEVASKLSSVIGMLSMVPAAIGQTPAGSNPAIAARINLIDQQLLEFKKT